MLNFNSVNPTRIVFGKGSIAKLAELVPAKARVLMIYGGGSIKQNGVYDQVRKALAGHTLCEFGGIEANPRCETCVKAVALARAEKIDFLLAVGGGSVIDATKFIAAAVKYAGNDPWDLLRDWSLIRDALPLGTVLTLPGTGSEMNPGAVISRESTHEKLHFLSDHAFPRFSILDPETTFSLPQRQFANGTIDAFVQVLEQYLTFDVKAPLQDRFAEGIMQTIVEEAPKVLANPRDYDARANIMWCATNALNGWIGCGVPQDWASHMIGHELTALYGMDHGQTLAVVMPRVMRHQRARKGAKLLQYAARVWQLTGGPEEERIDKAIAQTAAFFRSLGTPTELADYGVPSEVGGLVSQRLAARNMRLGEHEDIGRKEVEEILS
jgi:NADP-dependent alcohol dehydrogenase